MLTLTATEIDIDELTHLGVCHRGIYTAVDDRREGIAGAFGGFVTLADIHAGSQQCGRKSLACLFVHGCQFACNLLIVRRLEEETDTTQAYRVQFAIDPHTGGEIDPSCLIIAGLHIGFHLLRGRDVELCLPQRSLEEHVATGIDMERHDRIGLGRIPDEAVIDVEPSAEVEGAVCRAVLHIDRTVRFHLREVLLIDGIRDIGRRQDGHIDIRQNAVQRSGNTAPDVSSQFAIDGNRSPLRQFGRRKTIGSQRDIKSHAIEVESSGQRKEGAVCRIDR